jgi:hypothetical protein
MCFHHRCSVLCSKGSNLCGQQLIYDVTEVEKERGKETQGQEGEEEEAEEGEEREEGAKDADEEGAGDEGEDREVGVCLCLVMSFSLWYQQIHTKNKRTFGCVQPPAKRGEAIPFLAVGLRLIPTTSPQKRHFFFKKKQADVEAIYIRIKKMYFKQ